MVFTVSAMWAPQYDVLVILTDAACHTLQLVYIYPLMGAHVPVQYCQWHWLGMTAFHSCEYIAVLQCQCMAQAGEVVGDNPEQIKKQKAVKGLLNKITPEKFDKILEDLVNVGYETEETESGLIDQV